MALVESTFQVSVPKIENWESYENDLMREKMDVIQKISELKKVDYVEMLNEFLPDWKEYSKKHHINHNILIPSESKPKKAKIKRKRKPKPKKKIQASIATESNKSTELVETVIPTKQGIIPTESNKSTELVEKKSKGKTPNKKSKTPNKKSNSKIIIKKRRKPKN
jgi:hypothetical protein